MDIKSENPVIYLDDKDVNTIIRAYFEFNHLKQLFRQGWLERGIPRERCESVAEHSFGVALLTLFLAETYYPHLDLSKLLRMALIHDFGEIYAGDIIPGDSIPPDQKYALEYESVQRVFAGVPGGETYVDLWREYEAGETPESRLVRQVDRLEMALQASVYQHQGFQHLEEFFATASSALSLPELQNLMSELLELE